MEMITSERGRPQLLISGFTFNFQKSLAKKCQRWSCCKAKCKSFLKMAPDQQLLHGPTPHNHEPMQDNEIQRKRLSNTLKRKAVEETSIRPGKLIALALKNQGCDVKSITPADLSLIKRNVHNARHGSWVRAKAMEEPCEALPNVEVTTNTGAGTIKNKRQRGLPDTIGKDSNKHPKNRSVCEGNPIKQSTRAWMHFQKLALLNEQFQTRNLDGNVSDSLPATQTNDEISDEGNSSYAESVSGFHQNPNESSSESDQMESITEASEQLVVAAAKKRATNAIEQLLAIEERKLEAYQQKNATSLNDDSDYHFLMSLLPYLRKVPEQRKILVRTKLQQVFCDEETYGRC